MSVIKPKTPFNEAATPILDGGLFVEDRPLQIAGQDTVLRRYALGEPDSLRDTRCYLDLADLKYLAQIAHASPTKRVVLPCAGLIWELRRSRDGHQYEIFKITSREPHTERAPAGLVAPDPSWNPNAHLTDDELYQCFKDSNLTMGSNCIPEMEY